MASVRKYEPRVRAKGSDGKPLVDEDGKPVWTAGASVWRARYRDEAGKEYARHFERRVDAQRWLDEVTTTMVTGIYVDPNAGRMTFDTWFKKWSDLQVWTPGTVEAAERAATDLPFGATPINKITRTHVQAWVKDMEKRGLAASTIRTRYNYVHMAFRAAVGERILRDPSKLAAGQGVGIRLPKLAKPSEGMRIPSPEQVAAIYDGAAFYFKPFIAVCAFAGLRLGEAAGLQVGDVDFLGRGDHGVALHVQRQIQGQTRAQVREAAPKYRSDRWVPIPEELKLVLSEHLRMVGAFGAEGWIFTPDAAHLYNRNSAGNQFRNALKRAKVEGFTLHDLRHFYASGLIAAGCDVVTVQKALGHSSPTITLNTYAHLWPNAHDKIRAAAAGIVDGVLADSARTSIGIEPPDKAYQR